MTSAFPLVAMLLARGADVRSAPMCQISRLSEQRVAPAGRKPIFGPLSKNNTSMTSHFSVYSRGSTHDPHHTWHGDR